MKQLSREEKLELIAALEEKKRRELKRKPSFTPNPGSQTSLVMSEALERYVFCGNGWGKSTVLVNEIHWAATGYNPIKKTTSPVPAKILLVLDSPEKIDEILIEYRKWNYLSEDDTHKNGKPSISKLTFDNGSTVTVISHQVEPLKLEGSQWTHIFFDEPPPKQVFTGVARGGRIKGRPCRILLAGTPVTAAWLRTDIYEPWSKGEINDVEVFTGDSDENRSNLDDGWFDRFFSKLSEHEKAIRRKGQFHDLQGLALAHLWSRATHTIARDKLVWDKRYPCVIAIDPHTSKPNHAVVVGADRENNLVVLEEYKEKCVARRFAKALIGLDWFRKYRIVDIVYDSAANAEMTSGEGFEPFSIVFNQVMKAHGLGHARATTYDDKSDEDFITRIQESLVIEPGSVGPKLKVVADCRGSIGDIENVQWAKDKRLDENKPYLDIRNTDFLSCIKYALACNIYFGKSKDKAYYVKSKPYGINLGNRRANFLKKMKVGSAI